MSQGSAPSGAPVFSIDASRGFAAWLAQQRASLAVTTYQVGKLFLFGVRPDGRLWIFNRNVGRCLGLGVGEGALWVTADAQILKLVDGLDPGEKSADGHDAVYVPQVSFFTGDVDAHDMALDGSGRLIFVNTLFNCLATVSSDHSFVPIWTPSFISRLAAEDRCHLNGLAMRDGKPAFVTAVALSDTFDGWRDQRRSGGVVIDVATNAIVCSGLSMPHSPRWHEGRLWLHNSGRGEFGWVDLESRTFRPLCFCPGYLRGLAFVGGYAVVGLSKPRDNKTFRGLDLDRRLGERRMEPRCGLYVVSLETGDIAHCLIIEGVVTELYDVGVIAGKRQPILVGPNSPELKRTISIGATDGRDLASKRGEAAS